MVPNRRAFQAFSAILLILSLFWIFISRANVSQPVQELVSAPQKGFLAPDFETITLDGEIIRLSELRGKPVILNLWASWCPPCREEMPALQNVAAEYADKGLIVLAVNMTAQDSREDAANFVNENQIYLRVLLDPAGDISRLYRVQALPTTYFIDAEGVIQDLIVGGPVADAVFRAQAADLTKGQP
jgi:thiol-disulfide isomerase/thioredoxin